MTRTFSQSSKKLLKPLNQLDEPLKHRLTGAVIWLSLLVFVVPTLLGEPVEFIQQISEKGMAIRQIDPLEIESLEAKDLGQQTTSNQVVETSRPSQAIAREAASPPSTDKIQINQLEANPNRFVVQVVSYKSEDNADRLIKRLNGRYALRKKFFEPNIYAVRSVGFHTKEEAIKLKQEIDKELKVNSVIIAYKATQQ